MNLYFNPNLDSEALRAKVFGGGIIVMQAAQAQSLELVEHANAMIGEAFHPHVAQKAQESLAVKDFVAIVAALKKRFTNDAQSKELLKKMLIGLGLDLEQTYFDVPRLRVVTSGGYLSSGVGYAYKPHRDTWYSSPAQQLNFWFPVHQLEPENCLEFFPTYWGIPVKNSSERFDYGEWIAEGRKNAHLHVTTDERQHPLPLEEVSATDSLRLVCGPGDTIVFSAEQLHGTVPNSSGKTRFSIDFRVIDLGDVRANRGPEKRDTQARGSTLNDFVRASDYEPIERALSQPSTA
jgi:hypothetical protein